MKSHLNSGAIQVDPRRVLVVFALYLYAFVWLVQSILTKNIWLNDLLRPYFPNWAVLLVGFSAPVTLALVGLRSIPWKVSMVFAFIGLIQAGMFGLVGERFRFLQASVTAFAFIEAYIILPRWNRWIEDRSISKDGTVLHLKRG